MRSNIYEVKFNMQSKLGNIWGYSFFRFVFHSSRGRKSIKEDIPITHRMQFSRFWSITIYDNIIFEQIYSSEDLQLCVLKFFFASIHLTRQKRSFSFLCFSKFTQKINNVKTVDLRSTFGIICSAQFRNVTWVFTEERQLESLWSGVIRVIPLRHPVPLVVMVIC